MKTQLISQDGKKSTIELPGMFSSTIRRDILLKVFESQKIKQPMGNTPFAGMKYSATGIIRHKRHAWKAGYGKGIARTPRKIMSRDGTSFNWVGASVANARGGRQAHPPKTAENQFRKINKKEQKIAIFSALAGIADKKSLEAKYNVSVKTEMPIVFDSSVLALKTKHFLVLLQSTYGELYEKILQVKAQRAGKGKGRGRRYKRSAGLLFVIGDDEKMSRKGIDVVKVKELKIKDLAPNGFPGRFACFTEKSIKQVAERFK